MSRIVIRRARVILVLTALVMLAFSGRLVYVQAVEGPELAAQALETRLARSTIDAPRGDIVDANGEILATSVRRYNVGVNQQLIATYRAEIEGEVKFGAVAAAAQLAPLLDADPAELGARMVGDSTFVYLARDLTPEQWREISALGIIGIEPEATTQRVYPNGNTAGNLIGFVGRDHEGLAGLELSFDSELTGTPGTSVVEIGLYGQPIPTGQREVTPAVPGSTLHLTTDRDLQYRVQELVDDTAQRYDAEWAAVVVEEIGTGRLLVIADSSTVDPGNYQASDADDRGSRAIQAYFEPGSTGKVATFAAALDAGVVTPETIFTTPDRITTASGQSFRDADDHATEDLTVAGIFATSSNTGTIQIGDLMSDEERHAYYQDFGLGTRIGIGMPGESAGVLTAPDQWDGRTRYTTMFGQGLGVSLLQNTSIAATLGNGGVRVQPRLIDGVTDADGRYEVTEVAEPERVVSEQTAEEMLLMMEGVMSDEGTGVLGQVDGYRTAGKTGTAQVVGPGGQLNRTVASFLGVAPADDPVIAVGIVVYHPGVQLPSSYIAAPLFADIVSAALPHLGVAPSGEQPELYPFRDEAE